ncbi:aminotransferase-like domain-containing protein [Sedimentibacter saalensis]|uniref:aminotransferase-like domain-containing protein n=1 Tax=Sedimentibacter saalensis TaxID=130788 RepID=UPI00289E8408|nr:PLP-dependent aminotransferase family protein [Sedimentibacter saalensis]
MKKVIVDWIPDKGSKEPVYQQIVDYISSKISNGDWVIGYYLPSERVLAEKFKVNRSTISVALDILKGYGIIEGKGRKGTVIASNTWSLMISSSEANWGSYVKSGYFKENLPTIQEINHMEFQEGMVRLGTGELSPKLYPSKMMKDVFVKLSQTVTSLNYLEPLGLLELREILSEKLKNKGIQCKPSNILITSGSLQALQLISVSILKQGLTIYTEAPSYIKSLQVFQSVGMQLLGINMDHEGIQYWKIAKERKNIEDAILYTIPTFHNPTGIVMSADRRRELFKFCIDNRIPVIEDDAYGDIWLENEPPKPLKSMDEHGMIIYLGTISKVLAPGLRIGWLVGSESIVNRLGDVKMQTDYGASSVSQWILKEVLCNTNYDQYLKETKIALKNRRDLMISALDKYFKELAVWETPKGGFYIWLVLKREISMEKLFQAAIKEGILLNIGSSYDFNKNNALRLSYSYIDEKDIIDNIKKLSILVRNLTKNSLFEVK